MTKSESEHVRGLGCLDDGVLGRSTASAVDRERKVIEIEHELALYRKLSREQDKLLVAYRPQKQPAESTLDLIEKYKKALALLRGLGK